MRLVDPDIELVACGSSNHGMPTFASWEATVLEHTYEYVDYISMHAYYEETDDLLDFLATAVDMDSFIDDVIAAADYVKAKKRHKRELGVAFDEWNVWYQTAYHQLPRRGWEHAPALIEDDFNVVDAVVVGSYLISLLNHAGRVKIGCQAQLVNIIAPIRTEPGGASWRQTIFDPFMHTARLARGVALRLPLQSPQMVTNSYGAVPALACAATWDEETGTLALFVVNRHASDEIVLEVDLHALNPTGVGEQWLLAGEDIRATNTKDAPDRVRARAVTTARLDGQHLTVPLPAVSWTALTLTCDTSVRRAVVV
jgi:alpha-N-arabinofuranosidase